MLKFFQRPSYKSYTLIISSKLTTIIKSFTLFPLFLAFHKSVNENSLVKCAQKRHNNPQTKRLTKTHKKDSNERRTVSESQRTED